MAAKQSVPMDRTHPKTFGEMWQELIANSPNIRRKIAEGRVPLVWPEVVGERIAGLTGAMVLRNGVLQITMHSSAAAHDLNMRRKTVMARLNETLGVEVVKNLVVR